MDYQYHPEKDGATATKIASPCINEVAAPLDGDPRTT